MNGRDDRHRAGKPLRLREFLPYVPTQAQLIRWACGAARQVFRRTDVVLAAQSVSAVQRSELGGIADFTAGLFDEELSVCGVHVAVELPVSTDFLVGWVDQLLCPILRKGHRTTAYYAHKRELPLMHVITAATTQLYNLHL